MMGLESLPQVITAIGGLGTAAFGIVDATKVFGGGAEWSRSPHQWRGRLAWGVVRRVFIHPGSVTQMSRLRVRAEAYVSRRWSNSSVAIVCEGSFGAAPIFSARRALVMAGL